VQFDIVVCELYAVYYGKIIVTMIKEEYVTLIAIFRSGFIKTTFLALGLNN